MTKQIVEQEISPDGDYGSMIQTICPPEFITDPMVKWAADKSGLRTGDRITIQCMNHYKTLALHSCEYLVTGVEDVTQAPDGFDNPNQNLKTMRTVEMTRKWQSTSFGMAMLEAEKEEAEKDRQPTDGENSGTANTSAKPSKARAA